MNSVNNVINHINKGFHTSLELAAYTVTHSEPLEKVAKLIERIIRVAEVIMGTLSTAFLTLASQLKDTIIVFETLRFVGVMNLLICPKNGKYFLTDPANSWQKRADRVTLAFHSALKSFRGLNKFGFVEMGAMAKNAIGQLSIFALVTDSFILASNFFSSWESIANNLPKAHKKIADADSKIDKWEHRPAALDYLRVGDELECKYFETVYIAKANALHAHFDRLEKKVRFNDDKHQKALEVNEAGESRLPKAIQEKIIADSLSENKKIGIEIGKVEAKLQKTEQRIARLAARELTELAKELGKTDSTFKVKQWEVMKANAEQEQTKVWLRIANAIGKIAVVSFALVLTSINLWTAPFTLSLLFLGIVVDSIGLSKILVEEFWKPKPIPKNTAVFAA